MVRDGSLVASTIALLERQLQRTGPSSSSRENLDSSMDDSTIKCNSSTDSGKDDHSLTSTSSTASNSDKEGNNGEDTICCKEDFRWLGGNGDKGNNEPTFPSEMPRRGRDPRKAESQNNEVKLRKTSVSLDRSGRRREKREHRCRSTHYSRSPGRSDCPCHGEFPPPPPQFWAPPPMDFRHCQKEYYHYYRPFPCDYSYRYMKPTSELQEQLRRLESDKESLTLQVAVLTDQVDAQAEKISDLERTIEGQKRQLTTSEDILQREMLTRSSLETQKLELLAVVSELKRHETALERDNIELRERLADEKRRNKPPLAPRAHIYPQSTSTPNALDKARGFSPSPSPVSIVSSQRKFDYDNTPTNQRIIGAGYRSLPREQVSGGDSALRRAVVFGRPTDQPRCSSVPNLAETETTITDKETTEGEAYSQESSPSMQTNAPKGIRKIFGKMKRSGSGNLDEIPPDEPFTRGGVRSTAGPRLCGNSTSNPRSEIPFADWSVDYICDWLKEMGLESSIPDARRWVKSGSSLLSATPQEIDKELNIKNGLLRKKLHFALEAERGGSSDPHLANSSRLEAGWVLRWLDDIGLPQYKAGFMSARVDGRVLHRLTLDDLHSLHISLALHVASIRTGIQVLRKENFDPHCLVRRSDPEAEEKVELWTNHRVMEWLRAIDLAEYAPNLRGSGVHGGLMIYEERFNDSLLAALLSIPSEKTLLRRHLSTHFKELVGSEVMQKKREAESVLGYVPLTTTSKVKIPKKSQFTLKRKKSKYDLDEGDLVCPLDSSKSNQSTGENSPNLSKSPNHHVAASPDKAILTSQV